MAVLENQNKALIEELKSLKELYCQTKIDWDRQDDDDDAVGTEVAATDNYENDVDNVADTAVADNAAVSSVDFAVTSTNCENAAANGVFNSNALSETEALTADNTLQQYDDDGDNSNCCKDDPTVECVAAEQTDFQVNNRLQVLDVGKAVPSVAAAEATKTTTTIVRRIVVANMNAVAAAAVKATAATVVFVPARPPTNC